MAALTLESPYSAIPPGSVTSITQGDQKNLHLILGDDLDVPASMMEPSATLSYVVRAGFYTVSTSISGPDRDRIKLTSWAKVPNVSQRTLQSALTTEGVLVSIPADLWTSEIPVGPSTNVPLVLIWVEITDSASTPPSIANRALRLIIRRGPLSGEIS